MAHQRLRIFYSGTVQGVGFRMTAAGVAGRHAVTGFVRNLPDGRVELVAEGDAAELDRLAAAIADRMRGYIDAADRHTSDAVGEFDGFAVRR